MQYHLFLLASAGLPWFFFLVGAAPSQVQCSAGRRADDITCCKWLDVLDDIQENLFDNGVCGSEARESLRIMFHDAISFSNSKKRGGGANGSLMSHAEIELSYAENLGLDEIVNEQRFFALKHRVSFGDFLYFAGAVGTSNCPGSPQLQFLAGRSNISRPAPDGMIPAPWHSANTVLDRMADAGFSPDEVVALLASHTIAVQRMIDPTIDGMPLDSTPHLFDSQFFADTLLEGTQFPGNGSNHGQVRSPNASQFRLQSDYELARDTRTSSTWRAFSNSHSEMSEKFAKAMAKLTTLGQDVTKLIDCTSVIPVSLPLKPSEAFESRRSETNIDARR